MDYEALKQGFSAAVPFANFIGLEVTDLAPGTATIRLPDDERLRNHVGSQHAAGLFAVAETASGGAFLATFAERIGDVRPLAASADISYVKLAKGPIDAVARLEGADELITTLDAEGKVSFPVHVTLTDQDGQTVATATVQWHVRLNT